MHLPKRKESHLKRLKKSCNESSISILLTLAFWNNLLSRILTIRLKDYLKKRAKKLVQSYRLKNLFDFKSAKKFKFLVSLKKGYKNDSLDYSHHISRFIIFCREDRNFNIFMGFECGFNRGNSDRVSPIKRKKVFCFCSSGCVSLSW